MDILLTMDENMLTCQKFNENESNRCGAFY